MHTEIELWRMTKLLIWKTQKKDLETIVSMENDSENSKFIIPNSKEEHQQLITNKDIEHLILKTETNEMVGFVILAGLENKNKSIEFRRIVIKQKGSGFGRIAIKTIKRHCFEKLQCHRLWLDVMETNARARHLYQSEGFREEGEPQECILMNNKIEILIIMSIHKDEYKNTF